MSARTMNVKTAIAGAMEEDLINAILILIQISTDVAEKDVQETFSATLRTAKKDTAREKDFRGGALP